MYKRAISILSILLVAVLMFSMITPVLAYNVPVNKSVVETQITPRFTTIANITPTIVIEGLKVKVTTTLMSQYSTNLKIVVELQKEKSSGYETIETWTKSGNGTYLFLEESRLINVLSNYRIKVTCTADSESNVTYRYPA